MNREMLKQQITGTIVTWHGVDSLSQLADRILALLTPPATAKLPEGVKIHHAKRTTDSSYFWVGNSTGDMYFSETLGWKPLLDNGSPGSLWTQQEDAVKSALSAPPVPGESKPKTPAEVLKENLVWGTIDGHVFACAHSEDSVAILNAVDAQRARIAELEADNTRLRAQYDMVEQERTRLMLGQQVPYTPAEKPDPRKVAPNGRAMARYELCGPNREYNMHGIDDEGHDWAWAHEGMWIEPFPACMDSRRTPCTFDGTPITETKPDPLARAVTVGEMLRLADNLKKGDLYFLCNHIRRVFTPPQGASHVE